MTAPSFPFEPELAVHAETRQCLSKKHKQPRNPYISSCSSVLTNTYPENDGTDGKGK